MMAYSLFKKAKAHSQEKKDKKARETVEDQTLARVPDYPVSQEYYGSQ